MHVVIKIKRHIENLEDNVAKETNNTAKNKIQQNINNAKSNLDKIKICFINALKSKARAYGLIDPPAAQGGHCGIKRPRKTQSLAANKEQRMAMPDPRYWNQTTLDALKQIPLSESDTLQYVTIGLDCNVYVKSDTSCENSPVSGDETFPYIEGSLEW
jgi:hypothetical protein